MGLEEKVNKGQQQLLLIYNMFRIFCLLLFAVTLFFAKPDQGFSTLSYILILSGYAITAIWIFYLTYNCRISYTRHVLIAGIIDILFISSLISYSSNLQAPLSVLLIVIIAFLSILVPGRLAIFFAAIASCMLLIISFINYLYDDVHNINIFFTSGIYGAGIFATALTAWYLAQRVRISENLAHHRAKQLETIQNINHCIVERMHSGVIFLDNNQDIKLINSAARQFFNLKPYEKVDKLTELSSELNTRYQQFLAKAAINMQAAQSTINNPSLRVHFLLTDLDNHNSVLIFLDDLTIINQQAQQLKLASLGRFSASLAHELRNPLGAISHAIQLIGEEAPLPPQENRLRELIINNCSRMNSVIKNVLQLSRGQPSKPELIEVITFLKSFRADFLQYNQCVIQIHIENEEQLFIYFDKSQLEQVLIILFDNAVQHGNDEEGHTTIHISISQKTKYTQLRVCDEGKGIPEHLKNTIFDPFFSTKRTGFGIGLFLASDLCELNQAKLILLPSERGCCFAINLNHHTEIWL